MNKLEEVIKVLSDNTGISQNNIVCGIGLDGVKAQNILCFIVFKYYPELIYNLAKTINIRLSGCRTKYKDCAKQINTSKKMLIDVNKILKGLSLVPTNIYAKDYEKSWSDAKRLFGVENTLYDEIEIMDAIEQSNKFFKTYGQGRQPKYMESVI